MVEAQTRITEGLKTTFPNTSKNYHVCTDTFGSIATAFPNGEVLLHCLFAPQRALSVYIHSNLIPVSRYCCIGEEKTICIHCTISICIHCLCRVLHSLCRPLPVWSPLSVSIACVESSICIHCLCRVLYLYPLPVWSPLSVSIACVESSICIHCLRGILYLYPLPV